MAVFGSHKYHSGLRDEDQKKRRAKEMRDLLVIERSEDDGLLEIEKPVEVNGYNALNYNVSPGVTRILPRWDPWGDGREERV